MSTESPRPEGNVSRIDQTNHVGTQPHHFVEFYSEDVALAESVATYLAIGLSEGTPGVVIARSEHRHAIERSLGRSVDLDEARARKRFVSLDAEEVMTRFMQDDMPERDAFFHTIGEVVASVGGSTANPRLFGEMVAVLWEAGNIQGALALEDLWNEFLAVSPARLFCAYPAHVLEEGHEAAQVNHRHSHIVIATAEVS